MASQRFISLTARVQSVPHCSEMKESFYESLNFFYEKLLFIRITFPLSCLQSDVDSIPFFICSRSDLLEVFCASLSSAKGFQLYLMWNIFLFSTGNTYITGLLSPLLECKSGKRTIDKTIAASNSHIHSTNRAEQKEQFSPSEIFRALGTTRALSTDAARRDECVHLMYFIRRNIFSLISCIGSNETKTQTLDERAHQVWLRQLRQLASSYASKNWKNSCEKCGFNERSFISM